jgi:protein-disulfide isomerase
MAGSAGRVIPPLVVMLAAAGCTSPGSRAEIARLSRRVDSLAVTVTAINAALQGRMGPLRQDTITVRDIAAASLGADSAPVTIVEFTDYQCPFCAQHARGTFHAIKEQFVDSGTVRYVVRDLPLPMHPLAERAARAARCAGQQGSGQYWRYHDALFEAQSRLADTTFAEVARKIGLHPGRFEACTKSERIAALVRQDAEEAGHAGLSGTPSFVVGRAAGGKVTGVVINGAFPLDQFRRAIRGVLSQSADAVSASNPSRKE